MRNLQAGVAIGATEAATATLGMTINDESCPTRDEMPRHRHSKTAQLDDRHCPSPLSRI